MTRDQRKAINPIFLMMPPPKNMVIKSIIVSRFLPGSSFFDRGYAAATLKTIPRAVPVTVLKIEFPYAIGASP